MQSKIEKVPRGIRGEKSSKDMVSSRNVVSTIGAKWGTEPDARLDHFLDVFRLEEQDICINGERRSSKNTKV